MSDTNLDKSFFGRTEILALLKKRVMDLKEGCRQNVALLGNQYVGKSAILYAFLANIDEPDVTAIYLDLEDKDFHYFVNKFTGSLLYNYSKSRGLSPHDDLNLLMEATKAFLPQTIQVIKKIQKDYTQGKVAASLSGLLLLPEIFTNETGRYCILVIDEFQNLDKYGVPYVFQSLGKKIMTQKRCFYVMSSSRTCDARKILSEKLSLLFGNFETIEVDTFNGTVSRQCIRHILGDIIIGEPVCNFLADFTGGHPLYLNLIGRELINLCAVHKQSEVFQPLLSKAVENTLFDRWGVISRHFDLIINELCNGKGNDMVSMILISLSNGKFKMEEIVSALGTTKSQVSLRLARLIDQGIVVKNGNYHYFRDKLFKYWVKYVYQKRLRDVELAPDRQRRQFNEEFIAGMEDFNVTTRQDFSSRIIDLFYCFDNALLSLNGRKYRLPVFHEVVPCRFHGEQGHGIDAIKACTADAVWYIVSKKEFVGENDVNTILQETKQGESKPVRYLIISLQDLDENTRLKALQERFWIWNEQELKTLLTLFDKPYIAQ